MKSKTVSYTQNSLPRLSKEDKEHLRKLATGPEEEIDTTDLPELSEEQWKHAVHGRFYRPVKQQITARVDADVLHWLKSQGEGYQSRINAILRKEMLSASKQ